MTTRRKLLYAGGVTLLFLFHIIAAFALGVYVGRYGMTRDGLTIQGPRNVGQPAVQGPDQPGQVTLPGEPTAVGRVRQVGRSTLDLATREGPRQVMLSAETEYRDQTGETITWDNLSEGQIVAVFGVFGNGGQQLQAALIVVLPEPGAD
jgi:hypothetical protein